MTKKKPFVDPATAGAIGALAAQAAFQGAVGWIAAKLMSIVWHKIQKEDNGQATDPGVPQAEPRKET
jgi:hypothetical protein